MRFMCSRVILLHLIAVIVTQIHEMEARCPCSPAEKSQPPTARRIGFKKSGAPARIQLLGYIRLKGRL